MWQPARPLRDSAFAGLATAPRILVITLLQDFDVGEADATAIACAVCIWCQRHVRVADAPRQPTGGKPRRLP